jgi:phosphate transport system permease protein
VVIGLRAVTLEHSTTRSRPVPWLQSHASDKAFQGIASAIAAGIVLLVALIAWELWDGSAAGRQAFGLGFLTSSAWDPVARLFGGAPFIYGTLMTSLFALLFAAPLGVGAAIFLVEIAPRWLRTPVGFLVEMLAAIPSVIYGLWAFFVLVPIIRSQVEPFLRKTLGFLPLFSGPAYGVGYFAAGLVLTVMILPTVTAISQAVLITVPRAQREGAYALGATRWEVISGITIPAARAGVFGALILGLGRALGETMAVTMVSGNRPEISPSLFALGDTMASVIANQFTEASYQLYTSVLIYIGLVLFVLTVLLNMVARWLVIRIGRSVRGRS